MQTSLQYVTGRSMRGEPEPIALNVTVIRRQQALTIVTLNDAAFRIMLGAVDGIEHLIDAPENVADYLDRSGNRSGSSHAGRRVTG